MPKPKPNLSMELQCSLCPKSPKFSDVSHLLTHMSSKGHLAHRFKLQIRSQGELEARQRLENFDLWYHANNLDSLLSDRLTAKEKKRGGKNRDVPCIGSKNKKTSQPGRQCLISDEQNSFRAPVPRMHQWSSAVDGAEGYSVDDWQPSVTSDTSRDSQALQISPNLGFYDKIDSQLNTSLNPVKEVSENNIDNSDEYMENAKLKGILWPGMNLFDSATLEQKRMRNQRKGDEVLAAMMSASEQVIPAEVSYHPTGEFRASRDIFGPLSGDDSPIRDPTPKKRKSIRRVTALKDISTNTSRLRMPREKKKKESLSPKKQINLAPPSILNQQSLNPLTAGLAYNRQFQTTSDKDEEFRLIFNDNMSSKKRDFCIFQDSPQISPGPIETPLQEHHFDDLAPIVSGPETKCTSDKTICFQNALSPFDGQIRTLPGITKTSPSSGLRKPQRFGGKENLQPDAKNDSHDRRSTSSTHFYSSQLFYETPLNPLYHHSYTRSYSSTSHNDRIGIKSPNFSTFNGDYRPINPLAGAQESASCNTSSTLQYKF